MVPFTESSAVSAVRYFRSIRAGPSTQGGDDVAPQSPTVARLELSFRLRERRLELGLSLKQVADQLGVTRNYLSLVENDRTNLAAETLDKLCEVLALDNTESSELRELSAVGRRRGWWDDFPSIDRLVHRLSGLEEGATSIRTY